MAKSCHERSCSRWRPSNYRDTRISLFFGADILCLYQNLHLIHHMLPSIPFYQYRAAFDELRPLLERHGARIEGFWPTSPARSA